MISSVIVGIDLGTTTIECAYFDTKKGAPDLVRLNEGEKMQSVVYFRNGLIQNDDVIQDNETQKISNTKRLIGCSFKPSLVQQEKRMINYEIVKDPENRLCRIKYDKEHTISPTEVASILYSRVRNNIVNKFHTNNIKCILTVPAQFNDEQRNQTKKAALSANLEVIDILNEPTAAAYYCSKTQNYNDGDKILIFDFGAGTLDVSLVEMKNGNLRVIGSEGNNYLGGRDIDINVKEFLQEECKKKGYTRYLKELTEDKIMELCENAKIELSSKEETDIILKRFDDDDDYDDYIEDIKITITKNDFERINENIKTKCNEVVNKILSYCRCDKEDLKDVILVGGSTFIPFVQKIAESYCVNTKLERKASAQKVVSFGAALYAHQRISGASPVQDICSYYYGTSIYGTQFHSLVAKGTALPAEGSALYKTVEDYQTKCKFDLLQTSNLKSKTEDCINLGVFIIPNLPKRKVGDVKFRVTCRVELDGRVGLKAEIVEPLDCNERGRIHEIKCLTYDSSSDEVKKIQSNIASITEAKEEKKGILEEFKVQQKKLLTIQTILEEEFPEEYNKYSKGISEVLTYKSDKLDTIKKNVEYFSKYIEEMKKAKQKEVDNTPIKQEKQEIQEIDEKELIKKFENKVLKLKLEKMFLDLQSINPTDALKIKQELIEAIKRMKPDSKIRNFTELNDITDRIDKLQSQMSDK
ncbi:heat shock protein 70, putative [Entamoeba histolytica HM-1:IMSS-B]|uniref:Heat shock protein 70, putative n=2 Tax=Entamoeba histolytica (strain ATCC 30459 / HM-1:IMSS / ABRM) TaxID=294381 RepID=C4LW90_ENTH1|nr:heat shock protein 70, putative [Entamoeba histolytica HM-1:IMSS]EAL50367.2 heat shock protein 70, putative [Entamoeba histolytica HM-1:IMSS]EMH76857.1 heat shock protein 70, putative [Entamoeba histolytica HM-1:IMSS-B]|eukprot:XP_655753.2 heat shock protein 70, putative [Entamoeba histolytica HM-1:IMSS]